MARKPARSGRNTHINCPNCNQEIARGSLDSEMPRQVLCTCGHTIEVVHLKSMRTVGSNVQRMEGTSRPS